MQDVFPIVPGSAKPLIFLIVFLLIMLAISALVAYLILSSRNARFLLTENGLQIKGDLYGRTLAYQDLNLAEAKIVNLQQQSDLRPKSKTFGSNLGVFKVGWFRLQNHEKALLYITQVQDIVYIPTLKGYSLMLSPQHPELFLERLQYVGGIR